MSDRNKELARIHIAKKELGLDDDTYRAMLQEVAQVSSAKDLTDAGRRKVLAHMAERGAKSARAFRRRPNNLKTAERGPLLSKIEAILADAGREWAYVESMAQRMFGIASVRWCNPEQLHKIVAALMYDQKRRKARSAD